MQVAEVVKAPVLGVIGWSGSGKTTLLEYLVGQLAGRGIRVNVVKHSHHDIMLEPPHKDSARLRTAGAAEVMIALGAWSAGTIDLTRRAAPLDPTVPNIQAIGNLLYTRNVFVFEAAGFVLLVAMIGAIVLTHRPRAGGKPQNVSRQNKRRPQDAVRKVDAPVGEGIRL